MLLVVGVWHGREAGTGILPFDDQKGRHRGLLVLSTLVAAPKVTFSFLTTMRWALNG